MYRILCETCGVEKSRAEVMGAYWIKDGSSPCPHEKCKARETIEAADAAWRASRIASAAHCGPQRANCAVCGEEIGAYESRQFGKTGAVHVWAPNEIAKLANCYNTANKHLYPHYYTDG